MANISMKLEPDAEETAGAVVEVIKRWMAETVYRVIEKDNEDGEPITEMFDDRGGVVGPLVHPMQKTLSIMVWVHDDVALEFREAISQLFINDQLCASVRQHTKGLLSTEAE